MNKVLLLIICCFFLVSCSNNLEKNRVERISITGNQPVIIEQNYENENGNIRYVSKIEILGDRKSNSTQR